MPDQEKWMPSALKAKSNRRKSVSSHLPDRWSANLVSSSRTLRIFSLWRASGSVLGLWYDTCRTCS